MYGVLRDRCIYHMRSTLVFCTRRVLHSPWVYLNAELLLNQCRSRCNCLARQRLIGHEASPPSDQATNAPELTWGTCATSKCGLGLEDWDCFTPAAEIRIRITTRLNTMN